MPEVDPTAAVDSTAEVTLINFFPISAQAFLKTNEQMLKTAAEIATYVVPIYFFYRAPLTAATGVLVGCWLKISKGQLSSLLKTIQSIWDSFEQPEAACVTAGILYLIGTITPLTFCLCAYLTYHKMPLILNTTTQEKK